MSTFCSTEPDLSTKMYVALNLPMVLCRWFIVLTDPNSCVEESAKQIDSGGEVNRHEELQ